jgi:hypothetical protein
MSGQQCAAVARGSERALPARVGRFCPVSASAPDPRLPNRQPFSSPFSSTCPHCFAKRCRRADFPLSGVRWRRRERITSICHFPFSLLSPTMSLTRRRVSDARVERHVGCHFLRIHHGGTETRSRKFTETRELFQVLVSASFYCQWNRAHRRPDGGLPANGCQINHTPFSGRAHRVESTSVRRHE